MVGWIKVSNISKRLLGMDPVLLLQKLNDTTMFENNEGKRLSEQLMYVSKSPKRTRDITTEMFSESLTQICGVCALEPQHYKVPSSSET